MGLKNPLRMVASPTWDTVFIRKGLRFFESFVLLQLAHVPVHIIYNTRLLKRCQHMTVTYVVVILAAVLAVFLLDCFRLSDPNKDHNCLLYTSPSPRD